MKKIRFFLLIPILLFLLTGCVQDNTSKDNYTVKWLDYDGSILQEDLIVAAGEIPVYRQELPSREATKEFTFEFIGWDKKLEPVYEDQIYYAKYNQIIRKYEVKWLNYDEEIIKIETVNYGTVPSFNMPNPKKVETEKYTYKFIGWDKPLETVEENQVYQALYEEIIKTYSVKFIINGELISEQIIEHGSNANPPEHDELEGLTF